MPATTTIPAIEREVGLAATPDLVWRALTSDDELATWSCQAASFPAAAGQEGWFEWTAHGRFAVRCEAFDPPRRLAYRWARDPDVGIAAGPSTLVELTLTPRRGGTTLRVRESGFVRDEDREINVIGWTGTFSAIQDHLAGRQVSA